MNLTLYALTTSLLSTSPMLLLPSKSYHSSHLQISQIKLNFFFNNFLSSYTRIIHISIAKSFFTNFLGPPLLVENDAHINCLSLNNYSSTQFFTESDLCIDSCTFSDCQNKGWYCKGGAIYFVNKDSSLKIHATIFENCLCQGDGGAIFAASEKGDTNAGGSGSTSHKNMKSFFSHYCCYSGCSAEIVEPNNIKFSGYGSALFVASTKIELNYSSSIECPKGSSSYGAQFDMQTDDVKSCFINATNGDSVCCAAIEYRNAKSGFFSYQTIVDQIGGFVTSFTTLIGPVNISSCNFVNNTIRFTDFVPNCALIHVRVKSVVISRFVVFDTNFDGFDSSHHPFFASKGGDAVEEFFITVTDCIIEKKFDDVMYFGDVTTSLNSFVSDDDVVMTHTIKQLSLGDCQGVVQPPPMEVTPIFSRSEKFTFSEDFSMSTEFTFSKKFTKSDFLSPSSDFTRSGLFSETGGFSDSIDFSESEKFSDSEKLKSDSASELTKTAIFSSSNEFTSTDNFSSSYKFTESGSFTLSHEFTVSDDFSYSNEFTKTNKFSPSHEFTKTVNFSPSHDFTKTVDFSPTNKFTITAHFSPSDDFTKTAAFSHTDIFTITAHFSPSNDFTKTAVFSSSLEFSMSHHFTPSNTFNPTSEFSQSPSFTSLSASSHFTSSYKFSGTIDFTHSLILPVIEIKDSNDSDKSKLPLIGGVIGGACGVAAISGAAVFLVKWRKSSQIEFDIQDASNASSSEVVIQNPLYRQNMEDDPFQNDFAEHLASLDTSL